MKKITALLLVVMMIVSVFSISALAIPEYNTDSREHPQLTENLMLSIQKVSPLNFMDLLRLMHFRTVQKIQQQQVLFMHSMMMHMFMYSMM